MAPIRLRAPLLIAGAGALVLLVGLFGDAGAFAGMAAILIGTALSAPSAPRSGGGETNWWALLALGAGLALVGVPVGLAAEGLGGVIAAAGAAMAVVAVALAWR
jgi:hypothetical protein